MDKGVLKCPPKKAAAEGENLLSGLDLLLGACMHIERTDLIGKLSRQSDLCKIPWGGGLSALVQIRKPNLGFEGWSGTYVYKGQRIFLFLQNGGRKDYESCATISPLLYSIIY